MLQKCLTTTIIAKNMAKVTSRSFIFSRELLTAMRRQESQSMMLIESLVNYGNFELFIINRFISLDILPISFKSDNAVGNILLSLGGVTAIPREAVNTVKSVIDNMNVVLSQIVPGLTIGMKTLGDMLSEDGTRMVNIQLVSKKNEKMIPLQCESEGIKKIISVLQLLIVVYNKPSITVAIDELDAGVFEYLLGELLRIIAERGKGQLIFTSHNLRPLETLGREFIAFTTTDPNHRYIRFNRASASANLRDLYYRDIILGDKSEEIYNYTNNSEIAFAFREAGEMVGS